MTPKDRLADLALFGGAPAFKEPLHVGRPNIGDRSRLLSRIGEILDRRWLTNHGAMVQELESRVAELLGIRHAITVCNATSGLELTLRALGLQGEVIVPSFTFVATAHAVHWHGLIPRFCDVVPGRHSLDPALVERLITSRTSAILGVHLWGEPCDVTALEGLAARHGLRLVFDAAHAFGVGHRGSWIGQFGDAEVFSLHATKFVNAFEGGIVATNHDDLARRVRLTANFGFAGYDDVRSVGINAKMSEVSAAMALTSLDAMATFMSWNRDNYHLYRKKLEPLRGLRVFTFGEDEPRNYQYVVVEIDEESAGLSRDEVQVVLQSEGVLARRYFYPGCHRMEPYRSLWPDAGRTLPVTERLARTVLVLPTGTAVSSADIDLTCRILSLALLHAPDVRASLRGKGHAAG